MWGYAQGSCSQPWSLLSSMLEDVVSPPKLSSPFLSPLPARGRTNLELREKFILPEGASQGMTPFRSRGRRSKPSSRAASPTRSSSSASQSNHSCASMPSSPATPASGAKVGIRGEAFPFPLGTAGLQNPDEELQVSKTQRRSCKRCREEEGWGLEA